jgi:WD40 repeat protein
MASHQILRATLLADGRVLVLDGPNDPQRGPASSAVELYDPKTDTFLLTGSLLPGGVGEVLTRLNDGRVLVTGASPDSAAEIYDPASGQFSLTGRMVDGNRAAEDMYYDVPYTATTLRDGRVLIVGGVHWQVNAEANDTFLRSAELYDPTTGKFSATGSMTIAREHHTATLLPDGRVLIVGGDRDMRSLNYLASAEIYDPATGKFSATGSMSTPRSLHTATLLPDGRVLIAGGENAKSGGLASAELYDPTTGKFSATGSMVTGRSVHVASLLKNGLVLIAAGNDDGNPSNPLRSAELYDPATGTFSGTAPVLEQRPGYTYATELEDGRVLVVGDALHAAELYWP